MLPFATLKYSHLSNKRGVHDHRFWKSPPSTKTNPASTFIDFINIFQPLRLFQPPLLHYLVIITIFSPLFYSLQAVQWQFFNWNEVDTTN
jgi:hypothetical protein